jgi:hypothetical protein
LKYGASPTWFYRLPRDEQVLVLAHERAISQQAEKAHQKGRRGKGQPSPTSRRLVGQDALDALQGSKWGQLFQR